MLRVSVARRISEWPKVQAVIDKDVLGFAIHVRGRFGGGGEKDTCCPRSLWGTLGAARPAWLKHSYPVEGRMRRRDLVPDICERGVLLPPKSLLSRSLCIPALYGVEDPAVFLCGLGCGCRESPMDRRRPSKRITTFGISLRDIIARDRARARCERPGSSAGLLHTPSAPSNTAS